MKYLRDLIGGAQPPLPSSDSTPALASELIEVEQMADEIFDYLLSDRLFWQIVVETPTGRRRPKMTLGSLYERLTHLDSAEALGPNDRQRLTLAQDAWETSRRRYSDLFTEKLKRELDSYLKSWTYFLGQHNNDAERWKEDYEVELRNRRRVEVLIQLLGADAPSGLMDDLAALDSENND